MTRARLATAGVAVLTASWLTAASVAAEPEQRGPVTPPQALLTAASVNLGAGTEHGADRGENVDILNNPVYFETFRSSASGTKFGTEKARVTQNSFFNTAGEAPDAQVLRATTTTDLTASTTPGKPPDGYADAYADGSLSFDVQATNFLTVTVKGTLATDNSAGGGCSYVSLAVPDEKLGVREFTATDGPDCGVSNPRRRTVNQEIQLPPGSASFTVDAEVEANTPCDSSGCDPATDGAAEWDLTFTFCSNTFTTGSDLVLGTPGPDVLCGGPGDDQISGSDGNDIISGDAGNDIIEGGLGADFVEAGGGNDEVWGDTEANCGRVDDGGDDLFPDVGDDEIHGCGGNDWIFQGSALGVVADGGKGEDRIVGGPGPDIFFGGPGSDRVVGFGGDDILNGEGGNDNLEGRGGIDRLDGGSGNQDRCRPGGQAGDRTRNCEQ